MTAETVASYGDFIQEAFIDPIRSVLIIDDDYPTVEQALLGQINGEDRRTYDQPERILNVIKGFREEHPALIVDIHDGSTDEREQLAAYLHQSDLLILDYQLGDDGKKSVEIASSVFSNNHFNLIVLHTNSEPEEPFKQNLLALLAPCESLTKEENQNKIASGKQQFDEAGDDHRDLADRMKEAVGFQQYIHFRHPRNTQALSAVNRGEAPFSQFKDICNDMDWSRGTPTAVFLWALSEYEKHNASLFGGGQGRAENWAHISSERLWIRTNKGFITFVKKTDDIKLLDELKTSLEDWGPSPSRLMSAKLRAELDDQGVIAEDQVLGNKILHAKFYKDLYGEDAQEKRKVAIDGQLSRQFEDIGNHIKSNVSSFMERLVETDKTSNAHSEFLKNYSVDISGDRNNGAINKFNAYVSCAPRVTGWHLSPGHILKINDEKWACLSPSCDLVPGQKANVGIFGDVGDSKPFIAVKLHKRNSEPNRVQINSSNFLFLPSDSQADIIESYGFYQGSGTDPDQSLSPHWSLFVAENKGQFNPEEKKIRIAKIGCEEQEDESNAEETTPAQAFELKFDYIECEIVAQLRYEYALNLIQKLGAEQTRVGLGYISS